jgi:hypothetical protein
VEKTETFTKLEKRSVGLQKSRQAKIEMETAEIVHYEANLTYNIMIINLAYETIPRFKAERRGLFANMLKQMC